MFYQLIESGELVGAERLYGPGWELLPEQAADYSYPAYGWHWFETEAAAREFFGLPPAEPTEPAEPALEEPA